MGLVSAKPAAWRRPAGTPAPIMVRTTADARSPESSQLEGNFAVEMGLESVWPSTRTGFGSALRRGGDRRDDRARPPRGGWPSRG